MGIHYDYKSTRGDKAMKKEAKRKARIEQRRAKRSINSSKKPEEKLMKGRSIWEFTMIISLREAIKQ